MEKDKSHGKKKEDESCKRNKSKNGMKGIKERTEWKEQRKNEMKGTRGKWNDERIERNERN